MNHWFRNIIILVLMLAGSGLALSLAPSHKTADQVPALDLETIIPRTFGDWREEVQSSSQIVDPQTKEMIEKIYTQTLSRTYTNQNGYRIMLSIAYGADQGEGMTVHTPDVCYPAQGFTLRDRQKGTLGIPSGTIPVNRVLTSLGQRNEPVTYWTTMGDQVVDGGFNKKLVAVKYGLSGKIPDGMLIRVSSIDNEPVRAYEFQDQFSAQMVGAVTPEHRQRLTGNLKPD